MKRPLQLSLAIALALGATDAFALGLGTIRVNSGLNQPLDAEIPIIQSSPGEAEGLIIQLATDEDFERVGMSRSSIGVPVQFSLGKDSRGEPVVRITSKEAVSEPFLGLLLEANWPKGRLLREYNVLLDPPVMAPAVKGASAVAVAAKEPERAATEALPPSKPTPAPAAATKPAPAASSTAKAAPAPAKPAAPAKASAPSSGATEYGPVAAGETLGEIARATRPSEEISVNQMMLALLKNNPNAFFEDNINALKRGAVLRIPSAADVAQGESAREAAATVRAQIDEWRNHSSPTRAPTLVADTAPTATSQPSGSAVTKPSSDERLALVPPREGKASQDTGDRVGSGRAGDSGSAASKAELARVREALTSKEQETTELKSRLGDLEEIKSKNEKLISLQNSELAELRNKLKQLEDAQAKAKAEAATKATTATQPVTSKPVSETPAVTTLATATTTATPAKADTASPAATDQKITKDDIWGDAAPAGAAATTDAKATPATATPAATELPKATTTTETTPSSVSTPAATTPSSTPPADTKATAKAPVKAETKPATAKPVAKPTPAPTDDTPWYLQTWVLGAAAGGGLLLVLLGLLGLRKRKPVPSPRTSVASTFGDAQDSPASAQAAFGDDEQDLIDQVRSDPTNAGAHLELVSFYYAQGDSGKFEAAAEEMYAYIADPNEAHWREVRAMGEELVPHNPLFSNQGVLSGEQEGDADTFQFDDSNYGETPEFADETPGFAAAVTRDDANLRTASMPEFDASEFDVGDISVPPADSRAAAPAPSADTSFGFDLPSFEERPMSEPQKKQASASAIDSSDDEFFAGEDAIGTKLDLAKAYLDMGDPEGARAMLEEVLAEGAPAQQDEARKLIADMG